ncbi:ubiquinol-cytochrome c reductase iron-sulfur subunit [Aurantimonas sp. C2-6-R+9]|uniref:ubiquinol-cytochrome c reductase iron-sulfur subunit n=1 Tax=unclassified Aurantimonas TaxID=2638230 RepID=UPI002E18BE0E|nr:MULTISPECIES: ubiquinol-cytochrome c reductase iron-sulfur subunit [unclassified Aurantimonas]MEC5292575.1 ubiquinol-cytochrome c reductase iron-sulfur subunit [Aurantimonas sp. C2-3-R2]MEC5382041.1 ubiquinol-cytochrome c reductase iron-sulfur subunit [Aurantimonas sp. C2-6-R+9]MEC5413631.1 ubiquinol-cytochrome c reductase iron-sulfur subunit [Aurantimonas sp. C2-4-R8]
MSADMSGSESPAEGAGATRRDFLYIATGAMAAVGTAVALWPFIDSMNPAADVLALSSVDIDLSSVEIGQRITAMWRSRPVFIARRTPEEIARARADDNDPGLIDPATDASRVIQEEWLIVVGVCTHLGCIPLGQDPAAPHGDWGGWFCPCHGSVYDTAGRVRRSPAPRNLDVPPYEFLDNGAVRIG